MANRGVSKEAPLFRCRASSAIAAPAGTGKWSSLSFGRASSTSRRRKLNSAGETRQHTCLEAVQVQRDSEDWRSAESLPVRVIEEISGDTYGAQYGKAHHVDKIPGQRYLSDGGKGKSARYAL